METTRPFFEAIKAGNAEEVKRLLAADPTLVSATGENGVSALLTAIYYGEAAIADLLIAGDASLTLFEAAAAGKRERVETVIVENPALVNAYAPDGFQALGLAAFFGHTAIAQLLLEHGAEVNAPSRNGQRVMPLHSSVAGQHLALTKLLLEHGADVNATQEGGFTPLQGAAQNGQRKMVELLLKYGADKTVRSDGGQIALDIARAEGHEAVLSLLV